MSYPSPCPECSDRDCAHCPDAMPEQSDERPVKERPILFSAPMVRAILDGRKTVTRRIVKLTEFGPSDTPGYDWHFRDRRALWNDVSTARLVERWCHYGAPGDRLYVRETWRRSFGASKEIHYAADFDEYTRREKGPWKPGIHLPRALSRITLEVVSVRVERLQEITGTDARAEGITCQAHDPMGLPCGEDCHAAVGAYAELWDHINAERATWESNPWVWRVEFKREEAPRG